MEGRSHDVPKFGDGAQGHTARKRREKIFGTLVRSHNLSCATWPEYRIEMSLDAHVRFLALACNRRMTSGTLPTTLRAAMTDELERAMKSSKRPRYLRSHDRCRAARRWIRHNLAEAELFLLGQPVYATVPANDEQAEPALLAT